MTICRSLIDIANGMDYLHALGVLHCDLKGGNVLLKSTSIHDDPRGFICKARPCPTLPHPAHALPTFMCKARASPVRCPATGAARRGRSARDTMHARSPTSPVRPCAACCC